MKAFYALGLLTALLMGISQWMIWIYAPVERTMGLAQKIFYLHLPLAWWGFVSFFLVFLASLLFLLRKRKNHDLLAGAAAEVGVLFSTLVLLTGMIWARASWNTWWTWDPRLTTALVMWFVYCGYLILRSSDLGGERRRSICAVVGIVAFLDVPLVFISARMWRSIHPAVFASREGGLPQEMLLTVLVCLVAWGVLWAWICWLRYIQLKAAARIEQIQGL